MKVAGITTGTPACGRTGKVSDGAELEHEAAPAHCRLFHSPDRPTVHGPPEIISPSFSPTFRGKIYDMARSQQSCHIAAVGVHVVPDQRRDGLLVARSEAVGPGGSGQHLLQHEGVDEDHAILEQV